MDFAGFATSNIHNLMTTTTQTETDERTTLNKGKTNTMQAIETKYIGPTNYRGSRIKAFCERGSIIVSYDDALNADDAHVKAADMLARKFAAEDLKKYGSPIDTNPWMRPRVVGGTKKGYAHVYTS